MNRLTLALATSLFVAGCAARPTPPVVRAADLGKPGTVGPELVGLPVVLLFEKGDRIPLSVEIGGPLVQTPGGLAPIQLEVQRRFFLRLDEDGMATSLDGQSYGDVVSRGSFAVGVGATKAGPLASIKVVTPTLKEPDQSR